LFSTGNGEQRGDSGLRWQGFSTERTAYLIYDSNSMQQGT